MANYELQSKLEIIDLRVYNRTNGLAENVPSCSPDLGPVPPRTFEAASTFPT